MNTFEITIASVPDRENLVAEIWLENKMVCELNNENNRLEVIFYNEKESVYEYDSFIEALLKAKRELLK